MKPTGFISSSGEKSKISSFIEEQPKQTFTNNNTNLKDQGHADPVMKIFQPFVYDARVSLSITPLQAIPIKILRDTGALQSLILTNTLPFSTQSYSGKNVLIKGVHSSEYSPIPLHNIKLHSDLVSGDVVIGIIDSLPFGGIQLILGNDRAGDKVTVNPVLSNRPCTECIPVTAEQEILDLYPSCTVTRAMSKQISNDKTADERELSDTFIAHIFDNADGVKSIFKSNFIDAQRSDPEIASLIAQACDEKEIAEHAIGYYVKNGILMRKWRPADVCVDDEWSVRNQIVIPKTCRAEVLSLAHERPLAGHFGINKTHEKIIRHFYWPGIRKDVVEFCRTCHVCQMVGKPNQSISKAPSSPIPAFDEPFSKVMIDCLGPLPKTKKGDQYLLTIMCASTRFPEAIPLRNIKAKTIIDSLTKFFTLVGLPKSIQSDQGSNFMFGTFQQILHELGIKQYKSTTYHRETQGALERFHQTLKNMMRTYCLETEKDWDNGIHLLLFAANESVQKSLGFSPFELVFGHRVRGPLMLLKEKLLSTEGGSVNLPEYVSNFRTRLTKACDLAHKNLKSAQNRMKQTYDKNSVTRKFQP